MADASVFAEGPMLVGMQKVHATAETACACVGDLGLLEHALLVSAVEYPEGVSLRLVKTAFGSLGDPRHPTASLEEKELVVRVRDASDRRGFALRVTSKGRTRAALVDEAMAAELVAANHRLTEQAFEHLVLRMRALSGALDERRRASTFFPGIVLMLLCRYHGAVVRESSFMGMSSLQTAVLHALDGADEALGAARLAHRLGASEGIVEFQLAHLADKHVVRGEDAYELTEEGLNRIDGFSKRLSTKMEASLGAYSEQLVAQLEGLCDHCVYLLA